MPLSDDQRKLLKLLANQDEAYEAIAAATGASVGDLKAKAAEALVELERDEEVRDQGGRPAGDAPGQARASYRPSSRPKRQKQPPGNRRFAELIGGAMVVLLLILFATGAIDIGGGDSDDGGDGNAPALGGELPEGVAKRATQAVLRPVDGSDASGRALFGRLKKQVALVLAAKGLTPTSPGQSYAVSLVNAGGERIPIAATRVGSNGAIATQIVVPTTVLGALAGGYDEMEISLVVNKELEAALKGARGEESAPDFGGEPVLRGEVTGPVIVGGEGAGG